jgi:multidrug efflux system membrane fusion protein
MHNAVEILGGKLLVLAAVAAIHSGFAGQAAEAGEPSARVVTVAQAKLGEMAVYIRGLGVVAPINSVQITSKVDGEIAKAFFTEGNFVKTGDLLFQIDPRVYQAQVEGAEAYLAKDQAQLGAAQADLARGSHLLDSGFQTQKDFDARKSLVGQLQATLRSDQAKLDQTKLELDFATIRSPISGRVGKRITDVGNVVLARDAKPLVSVTQLNPIAVDFRVPQSDLPQIQSKLAQGDVTVEVLAQEDERVIERGKLTLVGDSIDRASGTILLHAVFANAEEHLWPGQMVSARVVMETEENTVLVPKGAVQDGPNGPLAYLVTADSAIEVRPVEPGAHTHDLVAIEHGIALGETVVTTGQDSLAPGLRVRAVQEGSGS